MAALRDYLGDVECRHCGRPTPVQRNSGGTVSMHCVACKWSGYAPPGSKAAAELTAKATGADPAPRPTDRPPAPRASFGLDQL